MASENHQSGFVNFEELFGKPLEEVSDDELLAKAQELRTRRKYPSVEKAENKRKDSINDLIESIKVQAGKTKKS
jgi:hypothetical protein